MVKNVLVIDCSPRQNGNTAYLVQEFMKKLDANYTHIKLFPQEQKNCVSPCIDCGYCLNHMGCAIDDDFSKISRKDYDLVIFASPIYMSNLPGPAFNLISRFNSYYNNLKVFKSKPTLKNKDAILILTYGSYPSPTLKGNDNLELPIKQSKYIFDRINADLKEENILKVKTDGVDITKDTKLLNEINKIVSKYKE